ncbi:ActS/PrrB/RegB family redox-sensitive histidine kinase [Hansschlegelia zhihuaiae]|uniref:histidine kinase n=1 Tax=Hansschlegelia zhihuaiae TaxID=405005 RepID=A0A4Q0MI62_9HYPH|nr:ActS/PrrB/RegB family redox-sensitive histidine kinase [Hansschlegelia zhihuaiae]RXF73154.1 HAMP domain-containing histidine kinase [Hansschlegelia zhihuaiae]
MARESDSASDRLTAHRDLRVDTLVRLRWLAVAGQSCALLGVHLALGFRLPLAACFAVIALSAALNLALRFRYPLTQRIRGSRAALMLGYDVIQLAALLYLTGGLQNPFSILFLAPVMISATALPPRTTAMLGALVMACATFIGLNHFPLPWAPGEAIQLPFLYVVGVWVALTLALVFIGIYAWRVSEEGRALSQALAATELVLAREQHLSALDGLAAAAAHELGTPLATIALVAKELERAIVPGAHDEDVALLREQVARCRDILKKLTSLDEQGAPYESMAVGHLLEEIVEPHRNFGVDLVITSAGVEGEPRWRRNPSVLYGLGNIVENAVDFARSRVDVTARWDGERLEIAVVDDGPGFAPEILARLGEPYVSTRGPERDASPDAGGLGLGFFIAKTLLERSGARVSIGNRPAPGTGARVRVTWPRPRFDSMADEAQGPALLRASLGAVGR